MTDEEIEEMFKRYHGRWDGDHWIIEDADLFPFVRACLAKQLDDIEQANNQQDKTS